ncbi:MAG: hypothetical protein QXW38_08465 [Candidatus Nitrosotenuis sp.]
MATDQTLDELDIKTILIRMERLEKEVDNLTRRINTLQKSVDLVYEDRSILEDINSQVVSLKQLVIDHQRHIDTSVKDVKADVGETKIAVESKVEEKINNLIAGIKSKKVLVVRDSLLDKLKKFLLRVY